jgi:hypothetical protein
MLTSAPPHSCFELLFSDRRMMPATVLPYSGSPPSAANSPCRRAAIFAVPHHLATSMAFP